MRIFEVKRGPHGSMRRSGGAGFSLTGCSWDVDSRRQRAADPVCCQCLASEIGVGTHGHWAHRLNAHLSSMVLSSFEMPAEVAARVAREDADRRGGPCRLSSFGFSGTIAHGAFVFGASSKREAETWRSSQY